MKTISYAITVCNEHVELEKLLDLINQHIRPQDEIVVQMDRLATEEVRLVADKYNVGTLYEYHRISYMLNNDFATFKNNLKDHCSRDYIFFIDADEYPSNQLIEHLPEILATNEADLYIVPRINTVEGLTQEHIAKWGWHVSDQGWINYPDGQTRIIKNKAGIEWVGKVHERVKGASAIATLPAGYDLIHPKTITKQEKQNNFYSTL